MPRNQPKPQLNIEHQIQLNDLHKEIDLIKNNHLHHLQLDLTNLSTEIKDTKDVFEKRFDKLDERLWLVVGLVVTTLVGIVVSGIM